MNGLTLTIQALYKNFTLLFAVIYVLLCEAQGAENVLTWAIYNILVVVN